MSLDIEERLIRVGDALPEPGVQVSARARKAALEALPSSKPAWRGVTWRRTGFVLSVAAAAAIGLFVIAPWQTSDASAAERALAAVSDQPVVHATVESPRSDEVVDLGSGETHRLPHRTEYWFDDERDSLRVRLWIGGQVLAEFVQTPEGMFTDRGKLDREVRPLPEFDPALGGFATNYQEALASGQAEEVRREEVGGRVEIILRFSPQADRFQEVAVDAETYRPTRRRAIWRGVSEESHWWPVVSIETVARSPTLFAAPPLGEPRPARQTGHGERGLTPDEAKSALDVRTLWPGPSVEGIDLSEIQLLQLRTNWTDGKETTSRALELRYGAGREAGVREPWLLITQGSSVTDVLRFHPLGPAVTPGQLVLIGLGGRAGVPESWLGSVRHDELWLTLESSRRDILLAAARALRAID